MLHLKRTDPIIRVRYRLQGENSYCSKIWLKIFLLYMYKSKGLIYFLVYIQNMVSAGKCQLVTMLRTKGGGGGGDSKYSQQVKINKTTCTPPPPIKKKKKEFYLAHSPPLPYKKRDPWALTVAWVCCNLVEDL